MSKAVRKVPDFVGRPAFKITDAVLKKVEDLASMGMPKRYIAVHLGISEDTLIRKVKEYASFAGAIERGRAALVLKCTGGLQDNAFKSTLTHPYGNAAVQWKLYEKFAGDPIAEQAKDEEVSEIIFRKTIKKSNATNPDD